jgi:hypothetical protein
VLLIICDSVSTSDTVSPHSHRKKVALGLTWAVSLSALGPIAVEPSISVSGAICARSIDKSARDQGRSTRGPCSVRIAGPTLSLARYVARQSTACWLMREQVKAKSLALGDQPAESADLRIRQGLALQRESHAYHSLRSGFSYRSALLESCRHGNTAMLGRTPCIPTNARRPGANPSRPTAHRASR